MGPTYNSEGPSPLPRFLDRKIKAAMGESPVVFLTGHPEYVGYLSDNEKFLLKPVDEGMLLAAVAACLKIDSDHVKER